MDNKIATYGGLGLVEQAVPPDNVRGMDGSFSLGHVRYGTSYLFDSEEIRNPNKIQQLKRQAVQPMTRGDGENGKKFPDFALAWNGHVANINAILSDLANLKPGLQEHDLVSDTSVIASLMQEMVAGGIGIHDALLQVLNKINGSFSVAVWGKEDGQDKIWALRDKHGIRPLALGGFSDGGWAVASEPGAFDVMGAEHEREIRPGEMVVISQDGLESHSAFASEPRECVFENIYLGRPDGVSKGRTHNIFRFETGKQLALEQPANADVVIGVPESGWYAARGYARESNIPYDEGLVRNRHNPVRSFLGSTTEDRLQKVKLKVSSVLTESVENKRVIVVDDSLVRANTMPWIVHLLKKKGAKEVHVRIASPPISHPCFYGVDLPNYEQLVASHSSVEEICQMVGADSLGYLSLEGLYKMYDKQDERLKKVGGAAYGFCDACMSGDYPTDVTSNLTSLKTS
jgi:amidophosphoribosyltransferase